MDFANLPRRRLIQGAAEREGDDPGQRHPVGLHHRQQHERLRTQVDRRAHRWGTRA